MTDPRPLRLRDDGPPLTDILAADGRLLATVYPKAPHGSRGDYSPLSTDLLRSYAEAEAIASEIVRAYNAHEDLVDALKAAMDHIGNGYQPPDLIAQANAALSKAGAS